MKETTKIQAFWKDHKTKIVVAGGALVLLAIGGVFVGLGIKDLKRGTIID